MNAELVVRLQAHADALTTRVLDEMYANPFWMERFGERGRQFARQDGQFHLSYLIQALVAGDPEVLVRYARWLQSVLTTRGMCTRHIDDNFDRLGRAIADEVEASAAACEYLAWARRALIYDNPVARGIQVSARSIASALAMPGIIEVDDLLYLLSYLSDAVAIDRPDVFADYVQWTTSSQSSAHRQREALVAALRAIRTGDHLSKVDLSLDARAAVHSVLDHALDRVATR